MYGRRLGYGNRYGGQDIVSDLFEMEAVEELLEGDPVDALEDEMLAEIF